MSEELLDSINKTFSCDWLVSQEEMSNFDKRTISSGITSSELMERAGQALFNEIIDYILKKKISSPLILVGSGNNGGDGLVIARLLCQAGVKVDVLIVLAKNYSTEMMNQLDKFIEVGGEVNLYSDSQDISCPLLNKSNVKVISDCKNLLRSSDLLIDALLGTGQRNAPRDYVAKLLALVHESEILNRIAIDIPTGINGDTGEVYENAFQADLTLVVQFCKRGLVQYPARSLCGEIKILPIGISAQENEIKYRILTSDNVVWLKKRKLWAHKNQFGHVAVLAGSRNMSGAGVLVSNAAMKCGSGLVTKFQISSSNALCFPEVMYHFFDDNDAGCFTKKMASEIIKNIERATVLVVGSGLGNEKTTAECVYKVLSATKIPTVIDASALNYIAENQELKLPSETILTPHSGEAARLLHCNVSEIEADRYKAAEEISKRYQAVVVLKGAGTIICDAGDGKVTGFVSDFANPYLATAGSGDVLAGMISACLAQGHSTLEAAKLAVYAHCLAGEKAYKTKKTFIVASDIIDNCDLEGNLCR